MAVVTISGSLTIDVLTRDDGSNHQAPAALSKATVKACRDKTIVTNGDSINSLVKIALIPATSVISPLSNFYHDALTSLTDFDIGVYDKNFVLKDIDCLADGLDISSAGTKSILAAVAIENRTKPLWELAGYTSNPGGDLWIVGTLKAASGATGDVAWELLYSDGAN